MQHLREATAAAGLENARTLLATGNLLFRSAENKEALHKILAAIITDHGLTNAVILRHPEDLTAILNKNPFPEAARTRPNHMLVQFLETPLSKDAIAALAEHPGPERILAEGREVYIDYKEGVGRSKLTPALLERHIGQPGTARNWNTISKLSEG